MEIVKIIVDHKMAGVSTFNICVQVCCVTKNTCKHTNTNRHIHIETVSSVLVFGLGGSRWLCIVQASKLIVVVFRPFSDQANLFWLIYSCTCRHDH